MHEIAPALRPVFDFRYARAGDRYRLAQDERGLIMEFDYRRSELERYTLHREGETLVPERIEPAVQVEQARIAGTISTNLYDAVDSLGESGELAHDFAEIFAWDIDFSRSVRPGDEFHILYERRYLKGEKGERRYVGAGRILAARYTPVIGEEHSAIYYEHGTRRGGYYRADGSAVERQFLQAPLTLPPHQLHLHDEPRTPDHGPPPPAPRHRLCGGYRHVGLGRRERSRDLPRLARRPRQDREDPPRERLRVVVRASVALPESRAGPARPAEAGDRLRGLDRALDGAPSPLPAHEERPARESLPDARGRSAADPARAHGAVRDARDGLLQALDPRALRVVTTEAL